MGYMSIAGIPFMLILAAILIPNYLRARISANESSAMSTVRTLSTAQVKYQANNPNVGYAADIISLGAEAGSVAEHCKGNNLCTLHGYQFMIRIDEQEPHQVFVITAVPETPDRTGARNFCLGTDGVLRYERPASARAAYSAEECAALTPVGE
jgi:hypothetical protein